MSSMWKDVFYSEKKEVSLANSGSIKKPRKKNPGYELPDPEDLEVYDGGGYVVDSFIEPETASQYIVVMYDHTEVCFDGEDPPSNYKRYLYVATEEDIENASGEEFSEFDE